MNWNPLLKGKRWKQNQTVSLFSASISLFCMVNMGLIDPPPCCPCHDELCLQIVSQNELLNTLTNHK